MNCTQLILFNLGLKKIQTMRIVFQHTCLTLLSNVCLLMHKMTEASSQKLNEFNKHNKIHNCLFLDLISPKHYSAFVCSSTLRRMGVVLGSQTIYIRAFPFPHACRLLNTLSRTP